jgi:hypothetical protein
MEPTTFIDEISRRQRLWTARILGALGVLLLLVDSVIKVLRLPEAVEGTVSLGYPASAVLPIGLIELVSLALYVYPRTSRAGAVLLTGFLGGAIATHVRLGSPLFSHTLFPLYIAALLWGAILLREPRRQGAGVGSTSPLRVIASQPVGATSRAV